MEDICFFFNKGIFDILLGFPSVFEGCLNSDKLKYEKNREI